MNDTELKQLDDILAKYTGGKNDLIPVLQEAQEKFGYLPEEVMQCVARHLRMPASTVYGVATFYALFKFSPVGKKIVRVCRGTACHVRGGAKILQEVEKELCIKAGETRADLEYTLETIACFGSCALAPIMVVDKTVYGRMTPARVGSILNGAKQAEVQQ